MKSRHFLDYNRVILSFLNLWLLAAVLTGQDYIDNVDHPNPRMRYKVVQSHFTKVKDLFSPYTAILDSFGRVRYERLRPVISGRDIPSLQELVDSGTLTYTELTLYYLYRMRLYETDPDKYLNALISLCGDALQQAAWCDRNRNNVTDRHPIFGMPLLVKDNIGTEGTATTAGAVALQRNFTGDATIISRLREKGAIVLGKVNMSEWAYYFCGGCPLGYSALGGQTLNPFGRKKFESGGSSSGSGVAVAAGYAVAAVGTETSGSILSPSSLNNLVGLKPTVGLLSRRGIVPISSTLDTPGPMTGSVRDNAILLDALAGYDAADTRSRQLPTQSFLADGLSPVSVKGMRLGVYTALLELPSYATAIAALEGAGAVLVRLDTFVVSLPGYLSLLNHDMKQDLSEYLRRAASVDVQVKSVRDVIAFNQVEPGRRAPYGQSLFEGIEEDTLSGQRLRQVKDSLFMIATGFFSTPAQKHGIDFFLSVNNTHAAYAALSYRPCLTIPVGLNEEGQPMALTLIGASWQEAQLLRAGLEVERLAGRRVLPAGYP